MTTIRDVHTPWRDALLPAMFDGRPFWTEAGSQSGGRRIAVHQFPKRDLPYAEDMGRRATEFVVRGYCVQYMFNAGPPPTVGQAGSGAVAALYMRDYRIARDMLQQRLDAGGNGVLQLPNSARGWAGPPLTMTVVCTQYRMTEEQRLGGYCVFDMTFVEFGAPASAPVTATVPLLQQQADGTLKMVTSNIAAGPQTGP
jgi:prophage DNA circulation protein